MPPSCCARCVRAWSSKPTLVLTQPSRPQIQTNAFHMFDADLGHTGIFLEPTLAMANHSCVPNAMVQFVGRTAVLRAERPIEAGDEIEISYTGPCLANLPIRLHALVCFRRICMLSLLRRRL